MSTTPNPLTGASWGASNNGPAMNASTPQNLLSLPGSGYGAPDGSKTPAYGNPGGFGNPLGGKETDRNVMMNNIIAGQMKNMLAPQFATLMGQYGGQAGNYFQNLMNLGSPYYQQQQSASNQAGVTQNNNAQGLARQQLAAQGVGNTPSGATAAMIGGMNQGGAQSLAQMYLQNLFQNENLQAQGAQGLSSLASLFNPTQLLGGTSAGASPVTSPTGPETFGQIMGGIGSVFGGGSAPGPGGSTIPF